MPDDEAGAREKFPFCNSYHGTEWARRKLPKKLKDLLFSAKHSRGGEAKKVVISGKRNKLIRSVRYGLLLLNGSLRRAIHYFLTGNFLNMMGTISLIVGFTPCRSFSSTFPWALVRQIISFFFLSIMSMTSVPSRKVVTFILP